VTTSYYVYYRTNAAVERVRAVTAPMFAALVRATGVRPRLLRRCDDTTTWMEVYEGIADRNDFEVALAGATERYEMHALLAPGTARHVERFIED